MAWAHVEPIAGVIRVFADDAKYGDPYVWNATVRYVNAQTVEILGFLVAPKPSTWRAIIELFTNDEGIDAIIFQRKRPNGIIQYKTINLKKRKLNRAMLILQS